MNAKKGFVIRFDHYPMLLALPMEQRGLLITALYVYADKVWRDPDVPAEDTADQFPQLTQESRMALAFMASAVQQDTRRWLEQRRSRSESQQLRRTQEGQFGSFSRSGQGGYPRLYRSTPSPEEEKRAAEDMARLRRLMDADRDAEQETEKDRP